MVEFLIKKDIKNIKVHYIVSNNNGCTLGVQVVILLIVHENVNQSI